jgi:uncharacterized repeat protein (TIGR01451 family)
MLNALVLFARIIRGRYKKLRCLIYTKASGRWQTAAKVLALCVSPFILSVNSFATTTTFTTTAAPGTYTVPVGVNQITIIARGADGGLATASAAFTSGQGATVTTVINVSPGDVVRFVVGAAGANGDLESGGGGGTGVFVNGVLALVAGGGGGEDNTGDGDGGQAGLNGTSVGANAGAAGTGGNGGGGGGGTAGDGGGGGGGILSAGGNVTSVGPSLTTGGGQADTNLGDGLSVSPGGTSNQITDPAGADGLGTSGGSGFGGGGAGSHRESGAGGGYSGGGGGGSSGRPGGGGSFQSIVITGYVSGSIAAGASGGGSAANGFVSISYIDPKVTVSKISIGGTGTFAFTGSNGFAGHSIVTVTAGVAAVGTTQTLTSPGITTTVTETAPPAGYALTALNCAGLGAGGTATPNLATRTITLDAAATVSGSNISCTFTNTRAIIKFQKITQGGTGGPFNFVTPVNIASAPAGITTATAGVAAPVSPTAINVTTIGSQIQLTESAVAGFALTAVSCTDANSAVTGNTGSFGSFTGTTLTIPVANVKAGSSFTCVFTNTRATVKFRKITLNGIGGPFTFSSPVNIASAPPAITTVTTGVAEPVSPTPINITTIGSQVQITEAATSGFVITSASCTDASSAVTGNVGAIGTLGGSTLTIPAPNVKVGVDFTCTFTNTKLVPAMTVVKSASTAGPVAAGAVVTYTFKVKNTGNTSVATVSLSDAFNGYGAAPLPKNETLSLDAAPLGDSSNGTVNDGVWASLGPGDEVTFTAPYTVVQSDVDFLQ